MRKMEAEGRGNSGEALFDAPGAFGWKENDNFGRIY